MGLRAIIASVTSFANQTFSNPTFTGTVTASQVTGMERVLAQWGVPCILASSGSMGDNGAVSGMTALDDTYSGGAWLYLPANSINGSNAAGFYWFVGSSTTAGTVYNSTWDGSGIPAAGTATAFVSTGPGAFTGIAAGEITCATVTVPAGAMGPNGSISADYVGANNTAAGNKTFRVKFGGTAYLGLVTSTSSASGGSLFIANNGVAGKQSGQGAMFNGLSAYSGVGSTLLSAVDTTAAVSILFTLEKATATNHAIWKAGRVKLVYGA